MRSRATSIVAARLKGRWEERVDYQVSKDTNGISNDGKCEPFSCAFPARRETVGAEISIRSKNKQRYRCKRGLQEKQFEKMRIGEGR